jgi:ankyrin repeat protein
MDIPQEIPTQEMCVKKSKTETNSIVCGISEMIQRMSTLDFFSHFVEIDIFKEHRNDPYLAKDIAEKVNSLNADPDEKGHILIHRVIIGGNFDVVRRMIEFNADLNYVSISGENHWTVLNVAYEYSTLEMFCLIIENGRLPMECKDGKTPISIQSMLDKKYKHFATTILHVDVDATLCLDTGKDSLLSWAVKKRDHKAIRILLIAKASPVKCITGTNFSPLHIAAGYDGGDPESVEILARGHSHVDLRSKEQPFTPLYCAVYANNTKIVQYLLLWKHADPNVYGKKTPFQTALHIATLHGNVHIVKNLLDYEANPFKKDQHETRPYDIGISMGGEMAKTYRSFLCSTQKAKENVSQLSRTIPDIIPGFKKPPVESPPVIQVKD